VTGEKYNRVSNAFWNAVHRTLSGQQEAAPSLEALEAELRGIRRRGW
jgi:trehalose/maltose transport system substrate-binding protein